MYDWERLHPLLASPQPETVDDWLDRQDPKTEQGKGLVEQMKQAREEVKSWPAWMRFKWMKE